MNLQELMTNVDGVDIPFDPTWSRIAVSLSGGADSTLLTYLLCDMIANTNPSIQVHVISHVRNWKTKPWQSHDSLAVYNYLQLKFPTVDFVRHENFIPPDLEWGVKGPNIVDEYGKLVSGDIIELRAFAEYICYHNQVDAYYNAVTRNPKDVDFQGMPTRDIDPTDDNQRLAVMMHMGKLACHPFRFVEKSWVIKQYRRLRILKLLDITRSCEGEFEGLDYTNYKPGESIPTCGECFWCRERAWAIEQSK